MRVVFYWFLVAFASFAAVCQARDQGLVFIKELQEADAGDYVVTKQGRTYTVLLVRSRSPQSMVLEEIAASERCGKPHRLSWKQWVERGAPNHTSWMAYVVSTSSGRVLDSYSHSRGSWLDTSHTDLFLSTLLTLNFSAVPDERRRRIGGRWQGEETLWTPRVIFEGQCYRDVPFETWEATWPRDGSWLSGKCVTVYLPLEETGFPRHFPYWLEITPAPGDNTVRVVDAGGGLSSPKKELAELAH